LTLLIYANNNYRQYIEVAAPLGTGYSKYYLNLGNIRNTGVEATVFAVPVANQHLKWTTTFNLAANKNRVVKIVRPGIAGANAKQCLLPERQQGHQYVLFHCTGRRFLG